MEWNKGEKIKKEKKKKGTDVNEAVRRMLR